MPILILSRPYSAGKVLFAVSAFLFIFFPVFVSAHTYGTNFLTGGTPSADSVYSSPTYTADKAVDSNTATFWMSGSGYPHWFKYSLSNSKAMGEFQIQRTDDPVQLAWSLKWSDDNSSWTEIQTGSFDPTDNSVETVEVDNTTQHLYWRWDFTSAESGGSYAAIRELSAFECLDCSATSSNNGTTTMPYTEQFFRFGTIIEICFVVFVAGSLVFYLIHRKK